MVENELFTMNLDCSNLRSYQPARKLYLQLIRFPQEIVPVMDFTITDIYLATFGDADLSNKGILVRPFGLGKSVSMRELNPSGSLFNCVIQFYII